MIKTVTNADAYIKSRLQSYPDFDMSDYDFLVYELDALQQLYFERLAPVYEYLEAQVDDELTTPLSLLLTSDGRAVESEDLAAVFIDGRELPRVCEEDFLDGAGECWAAFDGKLRLCTDAGDSHSRVLLICRALPAHLVPAGSSCTGGIAIPHKHLPLFNCRLKECVSRLAGDDEDADRWAKAFNEWIALLSENEKRLPFGVKKGEAL